MKKMSRFVLALGWLGAMAASVGAGPLPPLPEGAFSLVALPDTQAYSAGQPEVFEAEIQWVLDHRDEQRIVFVTHLGDIVDENGEPAQWDVAERCMKMLDGRVPYGLCVGNHDMVGSSGNSSNFQARFPASSFAGLPWYGGAYKNNASSWQTLSAGGMDFLIVHIECNAPDDVLAWAGQVLDEHPNHRAIVSTHMYLGPIDKPETPEDYYEAPKGRMRWKKCHGAAGNTPQEMWDKCFRRHKNLFLILCGDQSRTQTFHQRATGEAGNTVHEALSDYREGYLRVYRFVPGENRIDVFTYSPTLGKLCDGTPLVPDRARHQFAIPYAMPRPKRLGRNSSASAVEGETRRDYEYAALRVPPF
ncbi:MAG TPA: metallophosphoesterase [Candidatus Hydrogenedentes bacterium]|nr:metallophosphoesterase [Candidatus Hydrogenedentota bacterium]HNT88230.1 metallophosphoesterase [Candidatus Hydrogenedentota bacterium]